MNYRILMMLLPLTALLVMIGCKEDEVRVYEAPKEQEVAAQPKSPHGNMSMAMMSAMAAQIIWDTPSNWKQNPQQGMRYASFDIGVDPDVIDNSVISLSRQGQAGSYLPNVNRWLQQVGLETAKSEEELDQYLIRYEVAGEKAVRVDITGPEGDYGDPGKRVVAAIIPHGQKVWYFKMIGDSDDMMPYGDDFMKLILSVRFEEPTRPQRKPAAPSMAMDPNAIEDTSKGVGPLSYDVPSGWTEVAQPRSPRIAHLTLTNGHDNGEVAITRFPGDVGGALANVNRWRRQAGLGQVSSLEKHQPPIVKMMDGQAVLVDVSRPNGTADDAHRPRIIVLYYQREGYTWFFKMQGAYELLEQNKQAFVGFVKSVEFED